MYKGIITYEIEKPRFVDKITQTMFKMGLFKTYGYYPILDKTDKEVAQFVRIKGNRLVVRFLEIVTDYHDRKHTKKVEITY